MENQVSANEAAVDAFEATEGAAGNEFSATAENTVPPKKKKRHVNQQKLQDNLWGWAFCIPLIVGTVWFVYAALIMALLLSFTNYRVDGGNTLMEFLGNLGDNIYGKGTLSGEIDPVTGELITGAGGVQPFYWYSQLFTKTVETATGKGYYMNEMGMYLFNTVFYMIGIPIGMILSMFFAVCMSRDIKGGSVFRVLYYIPCVASTISVVFTFKLMFREEGVINQILGTNTVWIAGQQQFSWNDLYPKDPLPTSRFMNDPFWCQGLISKAMIVIMSVWKGLGGTIILYVAGLSGVNAATKEAAQIDGANAWKIFWKVTMPDLYPVIFYNIVTSVIGGLQIYTEPQLFFPTMNFGRELTGGFVSIIYFYSFDNGQASSPAAGAAYGMFLAVIIFVLTLFQFWLDSRKKD